MEDKISIIIPIYNAEKYLNKCILSIIGQDYKNWELLLIDDGSKDNSSEICRSFIEKDLRIKYFYQSNKGVSVARNAGIEMAKGQWVMFVDADDAIKHNTLSICSKFMCNYDIIRFEAIDSFGKILELPTCKPENYIYEVLCRKTFLSIWGGVFRKSLFIENNILFNPELKYGEDWAVLIQLLISSNKIFLLKESLYEYNNENPDSFLNTMNFKKQLNLILCLKEINKQCDGKIPEEYLKNTKHVIQFSIASTIIREKTEFKDYYCILKKQLPISFKDVVGDKTLPLKFKVILLLCINYNSMKLLNLFFSK